VFENAAGPSASSSKMNGVGARNVMGYRPRRRMSRLYGEAHFPSFASATVNQSAAPKEHALGDAGQGVPILFILHEYLGPPPAQG
jgi:hypothetical protein